MATSGATRDRHGQGGKAVGTAAGVVLVVAPALGEDADAYSVA